MDIMLDIQQKRKARSVAYHRVTLVILVLLVLFFAHSTWQVYQKKRESEQMKDVSEQNLAALEARNAELQADIANLQTDNGVEEEIRSKFNVAKAGESMVVVVDNSNTATSTATTTSGFLQRLKEIFAPH